MADTKRVSDHLLARLGEWGVRRVFGYAGDGINGILGAFGRAGDGVEFVQTPHEEVAALMACAHAKFTGDVGVCLATQGPGAVHLLNGLYDALLDHQPVVAIIGQVGRASMGGSLQQEIDLKVLFHDVAGAYVEVISSAEQVSHVVDRALRIALAERTVTCIIVPQDVQEMEAVERPPHEHGQLHSSVGYSPPRVLPAEEDLRRAAEVLNAGSRVAILAGAGALQAGAEIEAVAEVLGAGVAKALLGKAVLPDDLPFVTGSVGWLGTRASNEMMAECDTLLMIGSTFPYTEFLPPPGSARGVQIEIAPRRLNLRYPMEVGLTGDSSETLRALLPLLHRKEDRGWRQRIVGKVREWREEAEGLARRGDHPLNPRFVVREMSRRLPDHAVLCGDSGSAAVWLGRDVALRRGMSSSLSGSLATMGSAVPYALAAKIAFPDRVCVALSGDGAMQMIGLNTLIAVADRWRTWSDPRLVVLVLNNRDLNYVTWEQRVMEGMPEFTPSQQLRDLPYGRYAELLGLKGIRVETAEEVEQTWEEAFAADRPVVIDAVVDPDVPTFPPSLEPKQRAKLEAALSGGDPDAEGVREQLRKDGY
jgi:pyruvate dehydrogenase (quinone)